MAESFSHKYIVDECQVYVREFRGGAEATLLSIHKPEIWISIEAGFRFENLPGNRLKGLLDFDEDL